MSRCQIRPRVFYRTLKSYSCLPCEPVRFSRAISVSAAWLRQLIRPAQSVAQRVRVMVPIRAFFHNYPIKLTESFVVEEVSGMRATPDS